MSSTKISISLPTELLQRADRLLARPTEGRSALIARVLADAVRDAEEAAIDAAYERAYREHPVTPEDLERTNEMARAALHSTHGERRERGAAV